MGKRIKDRAVLQGWRGETFFLCIFVAVLFVLYVGAVCGNMVLTSDVLYAGTLLPMLTELAYLVLELLAFFVIYATVIDCTFHYGLKKVLLLCGLYALLTTLRQLALAVIEWNSLLIAPSDLWMQLLFKLANVLLELLQLGAVVVIAVLSVRSFDRTYAVMQRATRQLSEQCPPRERLVFPKRKNRMLQDPIKRACLLCGLLISTVRIAGRLIYDCMLGAPVDLADAFWMVLYYSLDILIGVGGYFFMLLVLKMLSRMRKIPKN